jgi:hypothetical protein
MQTQNNISFILSFLPTFSNTIPEQKFRRVNNKEKTATLSDKKEIKTILAIHKK